MLDELLSSAVLRVFPCHWTSVATAIGTRKCFATLENGLARSVYMTRVMPVCSTSSCITLTLEEQPMMPRDIYVVLAHTVSYPLQAMVKLQPTCVKLRRKERKGIKS